MLIARAVALALEDGFEPDGFLTALHDACRKEEYRSRLAIARTFLKQKPSREEVRDRLSNSVLAHESAVTAVYALCRFPEDFTAMIEFIISLGGDTDTIGAMAGGIFGARNGAKALPKELLAKLEARDELERLGRELFAARR